MGTNRYGAYNGKRKGRRTIRNGELISANGPRRVLCDKRMCVGDEANAYDAPVTSIYRGECFDE